MGPNMKLVNGVNPIHMQELNVDKQKAIFQKALPKLASATMAGNFEC